ncbi:hypothetical protein GJ496_005363 [Pomphorhynchus laevis]|nr:hypothetical protein GJ496_005363 [Pomphorhynchus laevis]
MFSSKTTYESTEKTILSEYEKIGFIGKGRSAHVYHVRRVIDENEYAMKIYLYCKPLFDLYSNANTCQNADNKTNNEDICVRYSSRHYFDSPNVISHAVSEVSILRKLSNPYIEKFIDVFKKNGLPFGVTLELVKGSSLSVIKIEGVPVSCIVFSISQLVCALSYLHRKNIIHRDIKSDNIMIDTNGHLKLIDFGFAKVLSCCARTFTKCGSIKFMAPEIFSDKGYGKPVDMWAVGILVYELIMDSIVKSDIINIHCPFKCLQVRYICKRPIKIVCPDYFGKSTNDLIHKLLCVDETKRITCDEIQKHDWFVNIDWDKMNRKECISPWTQYLMYD